MEGSSLALAARQTYRYLRVGIVVMTFVLAVSVVLAAGAEGWSWRDSISAYFYSPARSVFVGALMAIGICLVALQGRIAVEDGLLNLAGLLMPYVALVPIPFADARCAPAATCVPDDLVPGVVNNVWAYSLGALAAIGVAAWVAAREGRWRGSVRTALAIQCAVVVVLLIGLQLDRERFLTAAHYVTAVPLFVAMVAVVVVNGRYSRHRIRLGERTFAYARLYYPIALGMLAVLIVAGVLGAVGLFGGGPVMDGRWLLWVEVALLAAFAAFWVLQTAEFWRETVPEDLTCTLRDLFGRGG